MSTDQRARAAQLLRAYTPADSREREFKRHMLGLLASSGDPFARTHYLPGHFTASAFVCSPENDALYLIHHKGLGRWLQPGGHVEPDDEDLFAAAERELREEVGLETQWNGDERPGIFDIDIHPIPARGQEPEHRHFDVRFVFVAPALDAVHASDEVNGGRWVPLHDLTANETDASVMRAARKLGARGA